MATPPSRSQDRTAVEFFSGLGAFGIAARRSGIEVVAAFDQDATANRVYALNLGTVPRSRNLDSITRGEIPDGSIWWLSPPCTPFTRRGAGRDDADPRTASLANLLIRLDEVRPGVVMLENVSGFAGSNMHARTLRILAGAGYDVFETELCPTGFGSPMRRPRQFVVGTRSPHRFVAAPSRPPTSTPLAAFLDPDPAPGLDVSPELVRRYGRSFNMVDLDRSEARLICITSGYYKCMHGSGSYLRRPDGRVRRFSPGELARVLGFPADYRFPPDVDLAAQWRLVGDSLDVRAAAWLLAGLAGPLAFAAGS